MRTHSTWTTKVLRTASIVSALCFVLLGGASTASAYTVAAGCAMPSYPGTHRSFYVDPVNGNINNDGSQAHPWSTLAEVMSSGKIASSMYRTPYYTSGVPTYSGEKVPRNPNGVVHAGDIIYLLSGNHGAVNATQYVNSDFITVVAVPGSTPVLSSLNLSSSAKWVFQGVKVQSLKDGYSALVTMSSHGWQGPVNDIVFDGNVVSSIDDARPWTQADWVAKARHIGIGSDSGGYPESSCLTVTNNRIENIGTIGVGIGVNKFLLQGNTINEFGGDGIAYSASDVLISRNTITNSHDIGDGNHRDGMQGYIGRLTTPYNNVTIDSNMVIRQTYPELKFPSDMQGISNFNSAWTNLTVTNNIVVSYTWHGMTFSSVTRGLVANNIVLYDGGGVPGNVTTTPWINIGGASPNGPPSSDIVARNNISDVLMISGSAVADNNISFGKISLQGAWCSGPVCGDANRVIPTMGSSFVAYDKVNKRYDLRPVPASPAVGTGSSVSAPAYDIAGNARSAPLDLGAYTKNAGATAPAATAGLVIPQPTTVVTPPGDTSAPTAPTNLAGTATSQTGISLSWAASTDNVGVTGYKIFRGGVEVGASAGASYSDTGLTYGTAYTYSVAAFDGSGNVSAQSANATVSTQPATPISAFVIGDVVKTTARVNVRQTATPNGKPLGKQSAGATGTIVAGPASGGGYTYWKVDFASGADGYVVQDYITKQVIASEEAVSTFAQIKAQLHDLAQQISSLTMRLQAAAAAAGIEQ